MEAFLTILISFFIFAAGFGSGWLWCTRRVAKSLAKLSNEQLKDFAAMVAKERAS